MSYWLVVYLPLWKIWKSVGSTIPNLWKNKKIQTTNLHTHIYIYISLSLSNSYIYILLYTENLKLRIQAGQLSGSRALLDSLSNGPVSLWPGA
jgi:hypothetical protein